MTFQRIKVLDLAMCCMLKFRRILSKFMMFFDLIHLNTGIVVVPTLEVVSESSHLLT